MRQVVLDTETTGIGHENGHRIIEIGCVEIQNRRLTGRHFHVYLNPLREVDKGALKVHGITDAFLQDKPLFKSIMNEFIAFIEGSELIIHNAPFDVGFLNAELRLANSPKTIEDLCSLFDTLVYAREQHPGQRNNLDALCKRYEIKHANRTLHGALLDAEILSHLYLAMTGGQGELFGSEHKENVSNDWQLQHERLNSSSPLLLATEEELHLHDLFIQKMIKK